MIDRQPSGIPIAECIGRMRRTLVDQAAAYFHHPGHRLEIRGPIGGPYRVTAWGSGPQPYRQMHHGTPDAAAVNAWLELTRTDRPTMTAGTLRAALFGDTTR